MFPNVREIAEEIASQFKEEQGRMADELHEIRVILEKLVKVMIWQTNYSEGPTPPGKTRSKGAQ